MKRLWIVAAALVFGLGIGWLLGRATRQAPPAPSAPQTPTSASPDPWRAGEAWRKLRDLPAAEQRAALAAFAARLASAPQPATRLLRAQALTRLGRDAREDLEELEAAPPRVRVQARLLRLPLDASRLRFAREFTRWLEPVPDAGAWSQLLAALALARRQPAPARAAAEALQKQLFGEPAYWAHLATLRDLDGAGDEARAALGQALQLDPHDPALHCAEARLHLERTAGNQAEAALQRAHTLDPDSKELARLRLLLRSERLDVRQAELRALIGALRSPADWERFLATRLARGAFRANCERFVAAFPDYAGAWSRLASRRLLDEGTLAAATACLADGWQRAELPQSRARIATHLLRLVRDGAEIPKLPADSRLARLLRFGVESLHGEWATLRPRWEAAVAADPDDLFLACALLRERSWREPFQGVLADAAAFEARCRARGAAVELALWGERLASLTDEAAHRAASQRLQAAHELDPLGPEAPLGLARLEQWAEHLDETLDLLYEALPPYRHWETRLRLGLVASLFSRYIAVGTLNEAAASLPHSIALLRVLLIQYGSFNTHLPPAFRRMGGAGPARVDLVVALRDARARRSQALETLERLDGAKLSSGDRLLHIELAIVLGERETALRDLAFLQARWPQRPIVKIFAKQLGQ